MPQNPPVNPTQLLVVVSSFPDMEAARIMARALVEENLAACVQLMENMQSVYRWEGKLYEGQEVLLSAKTTHSKWALISRFIKDKHPYDLPEILAFAPEEYAQQYGEWVQSRVNSKI
jgi:periplasmic divalent cation tolerance protein